MPSHLMCPHSRRTHNMQRVLRMGSHEVQSVLWPCDAHDDAQRAFGDGGSCGLICGTRDISRLEATIRDRWNSKECPQSSWARTAEGSSWY